MANQENLGVNSKTYEAFRAAESLDSLRSLPENSYIYRFEELPEYLTEKFNLTRETMGKFLYEPSNDTQNERELMVAWSAGLLINDVLNKDIDISILAPQEDRGIDAYLRMVNPADLTVSNVPLQICEVFISPEGRHSPQLQVEVKATRSQDPHHSPEEEMFSYVKKAKALAMDENAILLCSIKPTDKFESDIMTLRDLFEGEDWPFRKIIFIWTSEEYSEMYTVSCKPGEQHFRILKTPQKGTVLTVGRSNEDVNANKDQADRDGGVRFSL